MASLDYYHGQVLDQIAEGEEAWQWAVLLQGGAIIKNWDERRTAAPEIPEGLGLLMTIFEDEQTQLVFGVVDPRTLEISQEHRVVFTPTQYSITDPVYAPTEEFPQRNIDVIVQYAKEYPPHLLEREQDGPDQEDEIAEGEADKATDSESTSDEADRN